MEQEISERKSNKFASSEPLTRPTFPCQGKATSPALRATSPTRGGFMRMAGLPVASERRAGTPHSPGSIPGIRTNCLEWIPGGKREKRQAAAAETVISSSICGFSSVSIERLAARARGWPLGEREGCAKQLNVYEILCKQASNGRIVCRERTASRQQSGPGRATAASRTGAEPPPRGMTSSVRLRLTPSPARGRLPGPDCGKG